MEENVQPEFKNLQVRTGLLIGKAPNSKPTLLYGTDWCEYTTKQKDAFKAAGVDFNYINCDKSKGKCAGITSFPTVRNYPNAGQGWVGFRPIGAKPVQPKAEPV